jgi:phosphoglycolate phosphatase
MIKGIIFDLDGTLVRIPIRYEVIYKNLQHLFDTSNEFKPLIPTILDLARGDENLIKQAFDIVCKEECLAANNIEIIDGAIETLYHFEKMNYLLGLVTMQCTIAAQFILDKLAISDIFSSVITRDVTSDRYEQINKSLEILSLIPTETIMVGDRIHDVISAKQAGCIAVLSNKNKLDFKECIVISKPSDLLKINITDIPNHDNNDEHSSLL